MRMTSKQIIPQKAAIFVVHLLFSTFLYAQTENQTVLKEQEPVRIKKYSLFGNIMDFRPDLPGDSYSFSSFHPIFKNFRNDIHFGNENPFRTFLFSQNKFESDLSGLGLIEHFTNQVRWNASSKINIDFGAGLAIQNTIMNPDIPNYQISFRAAIEYSFNDWLGAYLYGQYLTKPVNKPENYFDPFMYNNPLFIQNEMGGGLKANFKKTNLDFQIFSIYGSGLNKNSPVNSRIRIGF